MSTSFLRTEKRDLPMAVWVFIAAFAVRLLVLVHLSGSPYFFPDNGDMKFYNDWALRILKGHLTDHKAFYGLPGYAYGLAALYFVVGFSPFVVGLLQAVAEAITSTLIFKISQQVFGAREAETGKPGIQYRATIIGFAAAAGWVFFQPAQTFSVILMPTSWLVCMFWGLVWLVLRLKKVSVWNPWLWVGLAIGVMAMIVATILNLIPLLIVAIVLNVERGAAWSKRAPRFLTAVAILFVGVFAGMSPCWYHNYFIAHEPVLLSAHSGVNFYIGNNPIANGYPKIPPGMRAGQEGMLKDSITMAETAVGHPLKRVEVSHYWSEKANAYIHQNFGAWLKLMGVKFKNFWNAYQYDDLSLVTMFAEEGILTWGLKFGFVAALAIPGIFVAGYKYPRSRWVIAAVLLHMVAILPVFVTERYRLAAVPGLLILGAAGLWELWGWLVNVRIVPATVYAGGAVAAAMFVSQTPDDPGLWSLDYYNSGVKALNLYEADMADKNPTHAAVDLQRAQRDLDIAFAYVPLNSEINFSLGNLWMKRNNEKLAESFYLAAARMNSKHSSAFNNLGVLAIGQKRWDDATVFLTKSLAIDSSDAKVYFLLAEAREGAGDLPGAQQAIRHAQELSPNNPQIEQLATEIAGKSR